MRIPATLRSLARARGLSATAVVTLAFGIAALTTSFAIVNAALFRQPPFPEADRLVMLYIQRNPEGEPPRLERWSFGRYELLSGSQRSFEHVASYSPGELTLSEGADAELVEAERVSASYFPLLRLGAARGRVFTAAEDDPARSTPVVVLGHELWTRRWGADPTIVGRTLRVNGVPLTVLGVLAPGFGGLSGRADLWVPRTMTPRLTYADYVTTNQNFISAVGRLRAGVSLESARAELAVLGGSVNRALPSDPERPGERITATATPINEARADRTVRRSLFTLLGAVALLHLLACANVTNLLLGRAAARRREAAMRVALGSSTRGLVVHALGEGLVLGTAGGALGMALGGWAGSFVEPPANVWAPRNFYGSLAPFDTPAFGVAELAFGVALTAATALLIALPPVLGVLRIDLVSGLRAGARGVTDRAGTLRRPSARGVVVGLEAALAMLLVVIAGLLIQSFQRMRGTDIGVDPRNVLTFRVVPSEARVPPEAAPAFVARLLQALSAVPGVVAVSVDGGAPLAGSASSTLYVQGRPLPRPSEAPPVLRHYVGPQHFIALGIPLRRGRAFTDTDVAGAPRVAIISETAARRFWPDQDPLGRRVWFGGGSSFDSPERSAEIVGIVGDVAYDPLDQRPNYASFYTPYAQFTYASRTVFVRTVGDPRAVAPEVRRAVASVDPELAPHAVQPLTAVVSGSWVRHRFDAMLFGAFAAGALLLAASGIFAVLSYEVARRTRELGIRVAVGANPARIVRDVLRVGMAYPLAGLAVGVAAALATTRLLESSLYEISPQEPRVFAGTAALLVAVAAAACLVPAWRATRLNPLDALRAE